MTHMSLTIVPAAAAERLLNAGLRRGSGTRICGQISNEAERNSMRSTRSSSCSPQGKPGPADTKRSPGRHPDVTNVADTPTMGRCSERLEVPLEPTTTAQLAGGDSHRRLRILVVADEADVAQLIRDNPLTEGWEIFITGAGADVLAYVREVRPDNILLDITGSRFDGWEIYRRLKEDQETRAIPVIMIAGRFEQLDRVIDFEAGADAIVILP